MLKNNFCFYKQAFLIQLLLLKNQLIPSKLDSYEQWRIQDINFLFFLKFTILLLVLLIIFDQKIEHLDYNFYL
jgi:hypothetical protein